MINYKLPTFFLVGALVLLGMIFYLPVYVHVEGSPADNIIDDVTVIGTNKCELVVNREGDRWAEMYCAGRWPNSGNCPGAPSHRRLFQKIPPSCGSGSYITTQLVCPSESEPGAKFDYYCASTNTYRQEIKEKPNCVVVCDPGDNPTYAPPDLVGDACNQGTECPANTFLSTQSCSCVSSSDAGPSQPGIGPYGGGCLNALRNYNQVQCPYGYTSDSTGSWCCQVGCPILDCSEDQAECENNGGTWKGCCRGCFSPIVIDVAGNGFNLTDGAGGVDLDLTGEGTKDHTAWTAPNSDDAWLVLDRNHNGTIDNALELFGNFTEQPDSTPVKDRNGFLALAVFDQPQNGGNGDGKINRQDRIYNDLRLWQDTNHNGISEPNELHTLDSLDVRALLLDFKETKRTDNFGNRFKYRARVRDTRDADVGKFAWDVFLVKPR